MKKYLVDTNVIIRYLTQDLPDQAQRVKKRFLQAKRKEIILTLTGFTVAEILFVLESWYKLEKEDAISKVQTLITPDWIGLEKKEVILEALLCYREINIDFIDLLVWSLAKTEKIHILSFDKDFDRLYPKLRTEP